jgi:hypothetical protein
LHACRSTLEDPLFLTTFTDGSSTLEAMVRKLGEYLQRTYVGDNPIALYSTQNLNHAFSASFRILKLA